MPPKVNVSFSCMASPRVPLCSCLVMNTSLKRVRMGVTEPAPPVLRAIISTVAKWVPMASILRNRGVVESTAFSIVNSERALPAPAPPVALPIVARSPRRS